MALRVITLVTVLYFSTWLVNCTNDDSHTESFENNSLNGNWNLKSYGGGFSGQFTEYDKGSVTWRFDTINKTISIRNKLEYFGPDTGDYSYEIQEIDEDEVLVINDSTQGIIQVINDELIYANVLFATFKR